MWRHCGGSKECSDFRIDWELIVVKVALWQSELPAVQLQLRKDALSEQRLFKERV